MEWYKKLTINQKINLKDCCEMIVGVKFTDLLKFFNLKEVIEILYNKLILEGFVL